MICSVSGKEPRDQAKVILDKVDPEAAAWRLGKTKVYGDENRHPVCPTTASKCAMIRSVN